MPRHPSAEVDPSDAAYQRLATVNDACQRYALSRAKLYLLARQHPRVLRRLFGRTVCDLALMDELVDALPTAADKRIKGRTGLKHQSVGSAA